MTRRTRRASVPTLHFESSAARRSGRPFGWLLTVAERRLVDGLRSNAARARREERRALLEPVATEDVPVEQDDTHHGAGGRRRIAAFDTVRIR